MKKQTSATTETRLKSKTIIDFSGKIVFVGIDIHLKDWQVACFHEGVVLGNHRMGASSDNLIAHLRKHYPGAVYRCVYESGAWGFNLCRKLLASGIDCMVVHAADVPGSNKEIVNKTDKVDALMLARLHCGGLLKPIHVPDSTLEKQRNLIRLRKRLVADLQRTRNRIKSLLKFEGIDIPACFQQTKWSGAFICWLEEQAAQDEVLGDTLEIMIDEMKYLRQCLLKAEKKLSVLTKTCFEQKAGLIRTVPGIGRITSMLLLLELGDISRFKTFDQLNSFVGFYPGSHSSGEKSHDTGLTHRRNSALRSALIESAWTAVRKDPAMLDAFVQLKKRMEANKAIIRIARKLLRRIRTVMLSNQVYEKGVTSNGYMAVRAQSQHEFS